MRSRSFGDLGILDGEVVFATAFKDGIRPDEAMGVAEWADRYRVLSAVASSEPGRWRTDRTPYLREILDCLSPQSDVQSVVFMKGAQIGGSEAGYNWIGYIIHKAPGPTMIVQPSIDLAETTSKQRLAPMIELIPELKERIGEARSRDSGNTLLQKEFPGGMLKLAGANSAASLRSLPIKYLMLDETDAYDADVEGEGSPIDLAKKRTATFARKKILEISTPTLEGSSNIEASYLESDQRRFEVPCPHCNHYQVLRWSGMKWEKDPRGRPILSSVHYVCEAKACEKPIEEHQKGAMLARGRWAPQNKGATVAGFHLSALYSPLGWFSWKDAVDTFYKGVKNPAKLKTFINTTLGETFKVRAEDAPEWRDIYARREDRPLGTAPRRAVLLTAAVDVQKDRVEVTVVGWNRHECWIVDHVELAGDTSLPPGHGPWPALGSMLDRDWKHELGHVELRIELTLIDSGYNTMRVYEFVRSRPPGSIRAIKGQHDLPMAIGAPKRMEFRKKDGKRLKSGVRLWPVGTNLLKTEVMGRLKIRRPTDQEIDDVGFPPMYVHFPMLDEEYFKQVTAEQLILVPTVRGHAEYKWMKVYPKNEALDLLCYNIAAWYGIGAQKLSDDEWRTREADLGVKTERRAPPPESRPAPAADKEVPPSEPKKRRRGSFW